MAQAPRVRTLVDLLLPERCAACARPGHGLCRQCLRDAVAVRQPDGAPVWLREDVAALAPFRYEGVIARAVRSIKTPGRHAAARWLGELLWAEIGPHLGPASQWPRTWVPSTPARLRRRGADIPRILAGPEAVQLLRRVRQTSDQTDLAAAQRRISRAGDFRSDPAVPPDVVLVDDVRTTGGTAVAAAEALMDGGARRIVVVSLAAVDHPALNVSRRPRNVYDA